MTEKLTGRQAIEDALKEAEENHERCQRSIDATLMEQGGYEMQARAYRHALSHFPEPAKRGRKATVTTNGTAPARKPRRKPALGLTLTDLTGPPAA